MKPKFVIAIVVAVLGAVVAYILVQNRANISSEIPTPTLEESGMVGAPESDSKKLDVDEAVMPEIEEMSYDYEAEFRDISKGEDVLSVNTIGQAGGKIGASFKDGKYIMKATFSGLPDPKNGEFYEGWLIRLAPFKFISTGELVKINGVYTNIYMSEEDLTTLTRYALTVEPNDNNPEPGPHILEADLIAAQ